MNVSIEEISIVALLGIIMLLPRYNFFNIPPPHFDSKYSVLIYQAVKICLSWRHNKLLPSILQSQSHPLHQGLGTWSCFLQHSTIDGWLFVIATSKQSHLLRFKWQPPPLHIMLFNFDPRTSLSSTLFCFPFGMRAPKEQETCLFSSRVPRTWKSKGSRNMW